MKDCEQFDERQILDRGKAFKYGFLSGLLTLLVMFFVTDCLEVKGITSEMNFYICMWVPITVCTITLIVKDAYDAINQSSGMIIFSIFGICGAFLLVASIVHMITGRTVQGELVHTFMGACMLTICVTYWIKQRINKKRFDY